MMNALMPGEHDWMKGAMPGGQPMAKPQPAQPKRNPLMNALSTVFEYGAPEAFEAGRQKRMSRDVGNALAGGNYEQAANTYLKGGNIEQGLAVRGMGQEQQTAQRQQEAQSVLSLFSQMPALQINEYAMSDPANFERMTGMTSEEYLAAAQQSGDPEKFREFVITKAQAELGQMPAGPAEGKVVNNRLVDPITGAVRGDYSDPATRYRPLTAEEARSFGLPPNSGYQINETTGQIETLGRESAPMVNINTGDGPQENAFMKEAGALEAKNFGSLVEMGQTSRRNRVILDQLDTSAAAIPGGLEAVAKNYLGNMGIPTEGLSEIQATEALINQLVPAQRAPGSGPMSDRDLALFKASLPRLIQTPEGKTRILTNMKAINDYVISEGEIGSRVLSGQITPEAGRAEMQALGNPLAGDPRTGKPTGPQGEDLKGLMAPDGDPVTEEDVAETMRKYNVTREQVIAHLRGQ